MFHAPVLPSVSLGLGGYIWLHVRGAHGWNRRSDSDPEDVNLSWLVLNLWAYYQIFYIPAEPGE